MAMTRIKSKSKIGSGICPLVHVYKMDVWSDFLVNNGN
jgi:hypothetical protein